MFEEFGDCGNELRHTIHRKKTHNPLVKNFENIKQTEAHVDIICIKRLK